MEEGFASRLGHVLLISGVDYSFLKVAYYRCHFLLLIAFFLFFFIYCSAVLLHIMHFDLLEYLCECSAF
jgi:hypothetical protein